MSASPANSVISVAAVTSGRNEPSARYRVRQHIESLAQMGVQVTEYSPLWSKYGTLPKQVKQVKKIFSRTHSSAAPAPAVAVDDTFRPQNPLWHSALVLQRFPAIVKSRLHDITWLERNLMPGEFTLERFLHKPIVLDLDDALWLEKPNGEYALRKNIELASEIIVGNQFLAAWCQQFHPRVNVIPTAVDVDLFSPRHSPPGDHPFRIGWIGTSSNFIYLENVFPALENIVRSGKKIVLEIIADRKPNLPSLLEKNTEFVVWYPGVESRVAGFDVGLMPLLDSEWARGKCSLKMLQYMASGAVPVVSPVGMNAEVLNLGNCGLAADSMGDWQHQIEYLHDNPSIRHEMSVTGRKIVEEKFSQNVVAHQIGKVFQRLGKK